VPAKVALVDLSDFATSVKKALDLIGAGPVLARQKKVVIKPNLILNAPPPTTTDVKCVEAVILYCLEKAPGEVEIIVAEGSGGDSAADCFACLGYGDLAEQYGVRLIDLDAAPFRFQRNERAKIYKEFPVPEPVRDGFFISLPTLKDHSITGTTLSLKNMIGIAPAEHFSGYWSYKKSEVHRHDVDQAIIDINLHRPIDLAVIDGSIGQQFSHLSGRPCEPPKRKIIASFDPVAADAAGSELMGWKWTEIAHLKLANGVLGQAEDLEILD
jgi:uncharacterized protein (DUF362 family)